MVDEAYVMHHTSHQMTMLKKLIALAVVAFLFIVAYLPILKNLVITWHNSEDYSHGFLIIPMSIYFVWRLKSSLLQEKVQRANYALILVRENFLGAIRNIYSLE
jgi:hypothetical protein